ncbi:MAG TPA: type I polyketide synthase, partial [Polyangiales bacterium]
MLLKRLSRAQADGDHIYGVIRATSINHGGKTNGYTVPNPQAQAQVIGQALRASGVEVRAISYIEAHGTGTALGDPIEIAGLTRAFGESAAGELPRQYCAIGSVKSNIGHLESAAGIAGLTKVLLQMREGVLAPSLHAEVLNPHIDFASTPFRVQRELGVWERPVVEVGGERREYPRIAGISSFGAGGANAHVIVEEYRGEQAEAVAHTPEYPALIVVSAKTAGQLTVQVEQLLAHVRAARYEPRDLASIAYTLQVGREAMEHRLAFTASTLAELEHKLALCAAGRDEQLQDCYRGDVRASKEALSVLSSDADALSLAKSWLAKGKYGKLLDLWVKGLTFDWLQLYSGTLVDRSTHARRLSLPTYPFATERYWAPDDL